MRKTVLFILLTFISISVFAQIQRKFYDFHLGTTTDKEVVSYFKDKGKEYQFEGNSISVSDMKFGGEQWPNVIFNFYNNRLYSVLFINSELETPEASLEGTYNRLKRKLDEKYSIYYNKITSVNYFIGYTDEKTDACLRFAKIDGVYVLLIMYSDIELMQSEKDDGKDEL